MSTIETPPWPTGTPSAEANDVPPWLAQDPAAHVLGRVSSVLGRQRWPDRGELCWCGWGGPSAGLVASMPGRWIVEPTEGAKPDQTSRDGAATRALAGVHVMVDRLAADRGARLDEFSELWERVGIDGLIALTYPVQVGSDPAEGGAVGKLEAVVDHRQLIGELLDATSGRLLTDDLVVHHPESVAAATWATLVLRRLR